MDKKSHHDIWKYYGYIVLSNVLFFLPVDIIFFQERGLNLMEVFLINSIFSIGVAVLEVPTGAIADMIGRKKSLILGVFTWIISYLLFFYGWGFLALTVAYLTWALGSALTSGADTALIYDILHKNNKNDDFKKYQGIAKMLRSK
jgi:MFS family permease